MQFIDLASYELQCYGLVHSFTSIACVCSINLRLAHYSSPLRYNKEGLHNTRVARLEANP